MGNSNQIIYTRTISVESPLEPREAAETLKTAVPWSTPCTFLLRAAAVIIHRVELIREIHRELPNITRVKLVERGSVVRAIEAIAIEVDRCR